MTIDWIHFTPASALAVGMVIGIATAILLLLAGRIAGISGIVGGLFRRQPGDIGWRFAFVSGLMLAPIIWQLFKELPPIQIDTSYLIMALAGLIVGLGTRYASGCTSGHGVCGLGRLSVRSLVAVLTFMATGFITVFVTRHLLGW